MNDNGNPRQGLRYRAFGQEVRNHSPFKLPFLSRFRNQIALSLEIRRIAILANDSSDIVALLQGNLERLEADVARGACQLCSSINKETSESRQWILGLLGSFH